MRCQDIDQKVYSKKSELKEQAGIKLLLQATEFQSRFVSQAARMMITNLCNSFGRVNFSKEFPFDGSVLIQDSSKKHGIPHNSLSKSNSVFIGDKTNLNEHVICHLAFNDELIITFYDFELSKYHEGIRSNE